MALLCFRDKIFHSDPSTLFRVRFYNEFYYFLARTPDCVRKMHMLHSSAIFSKRPDSR